MENRPFHSWPNPRAGFGLLEANRHVGLDIGFHLAPVNVRTRQKSRIQAPLAIAKPSQKQRYISYINVLIIVFQYYCLTIRNHILIEYRY
ncbi:hypothetical protein D6851_06135 [Altericroceibacterium spongiae]|uniref:Uncharacterized protein n=1 Tax=Altericroceibacterium spongiae TaxID=2320269 RepID=A0A420ELN1_9SPHN|nr:hypothetical protein D6851_06135 [Altericroceibacterium spongiae]